MVICVARERGGEGPSSGPARHDCRSAVADFCMRMPLQVPSAIVSTRRSVLVAVSAAQLAIGVAGHLLALRRRLAYDVAVVHWRGDPEHMALESLLLGTAVSAPVAMLASQAVATARLARGQSLIAQRTLGVLGAAMTAGYLVERTGRAALAPRRWDRAITPIVVAGTGLAAAMGCLGFGRSTC